VGVKPRVLVVEDNPVVGAMIRHFLDKSGYAIAGMVTSGEEAIAVAGQCGADLALMDVELAGAMDGIEAADFIWRHCQIPVVYLTANADDETVCRAAWTEAYGYLNKPVQERELVSTIQIALSKHEAELNAQEKEKWLETTLRCISDAVIAADSVGCVKLVNSAAEALTGWTQEEAIGRDLLEVFKVLECENRAPAECAVTEVIREGGLRRTTLNRVLVARDGTESVVEESAAPIVNDRGSMVGVVLVFRPATAAPVFT
jgi:PAS domain S-box-containing protein